MKIGSLCSGYGGLDLGLQSVIGGDVVWHFEIDKHASRILDTHYDAPNYGDLTATDWDIEQVDWITAGYPCQPFSHAGNRKGTNDRRHIWPYIKDAIRTLQPGGVLLENVAGHLSLGFDTVLGDLAQIGYDANWLCLRASDAGAAHQRKRLFIVAHPNGHTRQEPQRTDRGIQATSQRLRGREDSRQTGQVSGSGSSALADANFDGSQTGNDQTGGTSSERQRWIIESFGPYSAAIERWESITGRPSPTPSDDGRLNTKFVEWLMGLEPGWVTETGISYTNQLKALGNGVVPQQAELALRLLGVGNDRM